MPSAPAWQAAASTSSGSWATSSSSHQQNGASCLLVSGLKTRKEIGGIPSVSAALVARAPALVGAFWRACVEKQREPEPRPAFLNEVPDDV